VLVPFATCNGNDPECGMAYFVAGISVTFT